MTKYPRKIKKSSKENEFIIIESTAGLSNRLRLLATYIFLAKAYYDVSQVVIVWTVNGHCPGHFLQGYEPPSNITFIDQDSRHIFAPYAKYVHKANNNPPRIILKQHNLSYNNRVIKSILISSYNHILKPTNVIEKLVMDYVTANNICNTTAIHVRRTDFLKHPVGSKNHTTDEDFFRFLDALPPEEKIFLITDNYETQKLFMAKYGNNRVIYYQRIRDSDPFFLRFTTYTHTVIDIWIAAHSRQFMGTAYSSLSDLRNMKDPKRYIYLHISSVPAIKPSPYETKTMQASQLF
eukprot:gene8383-17288_t